MPDGFDPNADWVGYERAPMKLGAVACGNPDAAEAGVEILERGGNAIDAVIATAFAMGVVEPLDSGLGAGGFMTVHHARTKTTTTFDFMGTAPVNAKYELFQAANPLGDYTVLVKDKANEIGHRSVAVPGAAAGLCRALDTFGRMPLKSVMAPAIRIAHDGFNVAPKAALRMARSKDMLSYMPATAAMLLKPDGGLYQSGDAMDMSEYGASLELIAEEGPRALYEGELGAKIVAEMEAHGGFLTADDLASYHVVRRPAAGGQYRGRRIATMGPPSTGFMVAKGLAALDAAGVPEDEHGRTKALAEAMLATFNARRRGLGDPAFVPSPIAPGGESTETTSLCAMDAVGNAACITFSNNNHSAVVVPGTGILLNNQMRLFHAWEGSANSVVGGKRPASSMMPTLLFEGSRAAMAIGASGATRIVTALMQIMFHHLGRDIPLEKAVREARVHAEEDQMMCDPDIADTARAVAGELGLSLSVQPVRDPMMAVCQTISVDADGMAVAVGDPRARAQGRVV